MPNELINVPENRQAGYDDEFQKMRERGQMGEDPEAGDNFYTGDEPEGGDNTKSLPSDEISSAENAGAGSTAEGSSVTPSEGEASLVGGNGAGGGEGDGKSNFSFKGGKSKAKSFAKKHKALLYGGGAAGLSFVALAVVLLVLSSSFKLQHLAENATVYNMARASRSFRQSFTGLTADSLEAQSLDQTGYSAMKRRFGAKVDQAIEKTDKFRYNKLAKQLDGEMTAVYEDGGPRKFLPGNRQILKGFDYKGTTLDKYDKKFMRPFKNYGERIRFSAEMDAIIEHQYRDSNTWVRGKVLKSALDKRKIKLYFWEKKGEKYRGFKRNKAAQIAKQEEFNRANHPTTTGCAEASVCSGADEVATAIKEDLNNAVKDPTNDLNPEQLSEQLSTKAAKTAARVVKVQTAQQVVQYASFIYAVAVPACLIFDGSIEKSGGTIDSSETALENTFFGARSGADQQKSGDVTPEAVGGLNDSIGNISSSIPMRRASGQVIDTTAEVNPTQLPQSTSTGTYSLVDVFLSGIIPNQTARTAVTKMAKSKCGLVTDWRVGVGLAIAELGVAFLVGGSSKAAEQGVTVGLKQFVQVFVEKFTVKAVTGAIKDNAAKFVLKIGLEVGATVGLTVLAANAVAKRANVANNALDVGTPLANQIDMGANIYGNQASREFLYGRPLGCSDLAESNHRNLAYMDQRSSVKSVGERYLAMGNATSMMSITADSFARVSSTPLAAMQSALPHLTDLFAAKSYVGLFGSLTGSKKASAATIKCTSGGDYNIVQWGYSNEEEDLVDNNPDYSPMINDLILDQSGKREKIEKEHGKCYSLTMGELLSKKLIVRNTDGTLVETKTSDGDEGDCAPQELGLHNKEFGDLVFRWRLSHRNQNVLEHITDLQDPQEAASNAASGNTPAAPQASGAGVTGPCAPGTVDLGIPTDAAKSVYLNGQPAQARLCGLTGIKSTSPESIPGSGYYVSDPVSGKGAEGLAIVNADASYKFFPMVTAALAAGIPLGSVSSFRTMARQQALFAANPDPARVARPGTSNHQSGQAIDFACSGSTVRGGDPCFVWLTKNAGTYGIQNYKPETWHWSTNGR